MNIKKSMLVMLSCLIISACQSFGDISKELTPGVGKTLVEEKMGRPDAFRQIETGYVYIYRQRLVSMSAWLYADYYYIFNKQNKLVAIEQSNINDKTAEKQQALRDLQNDLNQQEMRRLEQNRQNMEMFRDSQPKKIIICRQGQIGCF